MGPWVIWRMSRVGPSTTPLQPAYAHPRMVRMPGMALVFAWISGTCFACFDLVDDDLFGPPARHLRRIFLQYLFFDLQRVNP